MNKAFIPVICIVMFVLVSGCVQEEAKECEVEEDCPDRTCFAKECVDKNCSYAPIIPCCDNEKCEIGETYGNCMGDCPDCDDRDKCTEDSFDYDQQKCINEEIIPCCGNGQCEAVETYNTCVEDCVKSGVLNKDEVWGGTIQVTGDILAGEGVTLTILPGTTILVTANSDARNLFGFGECDGIENYDLLIGIKEEDNYNCGVHKGEPYRDEANHISITIMGILKAVGTEEDRIVFKSDSPNPTIYDWNHLDINNGILSYADVENYRCLDTKGDVEISHNNLKNVGECGVCANSNEAKIISNNISYAGHELIDMHDSSPFIHSNHLGPNPDHAGIIIDGGSPQITANNIEECVQGIAFISPPGDPIIENNTFLNNEENIAHTY